MTRIWEGGGESVAGGSMFHHAVEKFNRLATKDSSLRSLLQTASNRDSLFRGIMECFTTKALNRQVLNSKPADLIFNFSNCVEVYFGELADIMHYGRESGRDAEEIIRELFGVMPKKVDVTLHVGPNRRPVHITGRLDYVFFDWRSNSLRILDYKLTPASSPDNDLFQVMTYALLYHHQHRYECSAEVFYLHPQRHLVDIPWAQVYAERHKVYDLLASMVEWADYNADNKTGLHPPGKPHYCAHCRWKNVCEQRLGHKSEGESRHGWSKSRHNNEPEPQVDVTQPTETTDDAEDEEILTDIVEQPDANTPPQNLRHNHSAEAALYLGTSTQAHQPVSIGKPNLSTHTAIVGAAGSGKTWLAKVFIEEAIQQGVPVLAIDPQGDLVQFLHAMPRNKIPIDQCNRYDEFHSRVETRIYTPGTSHAIRLSLSPIRLPKPSDLSGLPAARRDEEFTAIVNAVATQLVSLTLKGKRSVEQQQTFLAQVLRGLIHHPSDRPLQLTDIATAVHAPEGIGIEDADFLIKKTERENLGRQLYALAHGPLARLFSGGQPLDIDDMKRPIQPGRIPLNVIYLNALSEPEKHAFLASLATEIYRWMSCSGGDPQSPQLLFYVDEARDFLPAGASMPPAKGPVSRLFTQGRKFGVGCAVCTQSPRSVDYNIFGNCSTKIIGRLETPQDSERVGEWFTTTGAKPEWVAGRAGADMGTFVARWPDQPEQLEGAVFRSRYLFSKHEGAWSPEQLEAETDRDPLHKRIRDSET